MQIEIFQLFMEIRVLDTGLKYRNMSHSFKTLWPKMTKIDLKLTQMTLMTTETNQVTILTNENFCSFTTL